MLVYFPNIDAFLVSRYSEEKVLLQCTIVKGAENAFHATNYLTEHEAFEALKLFNKDAQDPTHLQRFFFPVLSDKELEYKFIKLKK